MLYADHFRSDVSHADAAALFKKSVTVIEMAISSYCNRRCSYCPNSKVDRISKKHQMSDELFLSVLRQLSDIDYSEEISIHRYNEPLADRAYALRRLREIRAILPKAKMNVWTNGDYLDRDFVRELAETGVWRVITTIHEAAHGTTYPELLENQVRFVNRLGMPLKGASDMDGGARRCVVVDTGSPMELSVWANNFHARDAGGVLMMQDRGQSLSVTKGMERSSPCFMPFVQLQVEWDGELLPCCQIQPDAFGKNEYSLGRLTPQSDIFLEWTNANYARWRNDLFTYAPKKSPCATCNYGGWAQDTAQTREKVEIWRKMLGLDARKVEAAPAEVALVA